MRALFTYSIILEVDDEEHASRVALEIERGNELGLHHILELHPELSREDLGIDILGATVQVLPERSL